MGAAIALRFVGEEVQLFKRDRNDPQSAFYKIRKMRDTTPCEQNQKSIMQIARYIKQIYREEYATSLASTCTELSD